MRRNGTNRKIKDDRPRKLTSPKVRRSRERNKKTQRQITKENERKNQTSQRRTANPRRIHNGRK